MLHLNNSLLFLIVIPSVVGLTCGLVWAGVLMRWSVALYNIGLRDPKSRQRIPIPDRLRTLGMIINTWVSTVLCYGVLIGLCYLCVGLGRLNPATSLFLGMMWCAAVMLSYNFIATYVISLSLKTTFWRALLIQTYYTVFYVLTFIAFILAAKAVAQISGGSWGQTWMDYYGKLVWPSAG